MRLIRTIGVISCILTLAAPAAVQEQRPPFTPIFEEWWSLETNDRNRDGCFWMRIPEHCYQTYSLEPELAPQAFDMLQDLCRAASDESCSLLAHLLREEGNIEEALELFRGASRNRLALAFPLIEYDHGDLATALRQSRQDCFGDFSRCMFYVRYMPDHPRIPEFTALAELRCRTQQGVSIGATDCALLGSYYMSREWNPPKAQDLWRFDCHRGNPTSCELLMASDATDAHDAAVRYCDLHLLTLRNLSDEWNREAICGDIYTSATLAPRLRAGAENSIRGYLKEMRAVNRRPASH